MKCEIANNYTEISTKSKRNIYLYLANCVTIVLYMVDEGAVKMNFGQAIEALKDGKKVARSGWNGKGMWIVLMPELNLPSFNTQAAGPKVNDRTAKHIGNDTPLNSQPYIAMFNAQGLWQPGWNASTPDVLATDWTIAV